MIPAPRSSICVRHVILALGISAGFLGLVQRAQAAGLAIDASVKTHQASPSASITSGAFSTTAANDVLIAFLTSDGPGQAGGTSFSSVTGGGLTWKLRERVNAQPGTAEIWEAVAPSTLSNTTVTATRSAGSAAGSIVVVAFSGADTTVDGSVAGASGTSGAPSATLTATRSGSWVWSVGDDYDQAAARTVGSGQAVFDQYLAPVGDTYWVQSQTSPGNTAASAITSNDTAPTTDRWDFSAIEILPAVSDTTPPTVPTNLKGTANSATQVTLTWSASMDTVGVAGYNVLRNGTVIGTAAGTSFVDDTVSPSTTYSYTVTAFDAAGIVSGPSSPAGVTTPAASSNPPVISGITSTSLTDTSATIGWSTDIPSTSQVLYGTTAGYGLSSRLDGTQVRSHSETLTGLAPNTTYHFQVQSTGGSNNRATSGDNTFTTAQSNITLPDMQMKVPTNDISIGTDSSTGHRQLQFTHMTWDAGTGPLELDPTYNSATGTATFTQAIYRSTSPGVWTYDHSVPVATTGVFNSSLAHYQFPLTKFTLNTANADGTLGSLVATSPKTDYCLTADTFVGGVPNTPNQTFIPQADCNDPTKPLGWSVGWADQYDQTDVGQPIDLTGIADGAYVLRGIVDPNHVITETNANNNTVDTLLQIRGGTVTVLSQTNPGTSPPTVSMSAPANGANVSGTVSLQASPSATAPATVSSVQFLLDGQPLGSSVAGPPYVFSWTVGTTSVGGHTLSARVTDSQGNAATAPPITVNVVSGPTPPPNNPTVSITNPTNGQVVSGTIPVAASVTSNLTIASVQFFLDGKPLGAAVTASPYAIKWDTTTATAGSHTLSAQATDIQGDAGTSSNVNATVQNPAPPMTCFVLQAQVSVHGSTQAATPSFHTAAAGEVLVAFVSADGPAGGGTQHATVSGAGLTWTLVKRANSQSGDAEVWEATAPSVISSAAVTSTESARGFAQDLTVIALEGVKGIGASAAGSATSGAPSLSLTTMGSTSLVFAVGHDWNNAIARALPSGWVPLDQWVYAATGDTFWTQYTNTPTGLAGSVVAVNDTAPTNDQWNLVAVELLNDGS